MRFLFKSIITLSLGFASLLHAQSDSNLSPGLLKIGSYCVFRSSGYLGNLSLRPCVMSPSSLWYLTSGMGILSPSKNVITETYSDSTFHQTGVAVNLDSWSNAAYISTAITTGRIISGIFALHGGSDSRGFYCVGRGLTSIVTRSASTDCLRVSFFKSQK